MHMVILPPFTFPTMPAPTTIREAIYYMYIHDTPYALDACIAGEPDAMRALAKHRPFIAREANWSRRRHWMVGMCNGAAQEGSMWQRVAHMETLVLAQVMRYV